MRYALLALGCGVAAFSQPACAEDAQKKLVGTWKLVSLISTEVESKQEHKLFGERPSGFIHFGQDGRFFLVITGEGRKQPQTDEERAAAFRSMLAYTGPYRVEGDKYIVKVDVSWAEAWKDTEQVRTFALEGDQLHTETPPVASPALGGRMTVARLVFDRAK